jgi:putative ABC transport system permease protein
MLKHLIIASRFLFKHKEYSAINIGGLAFSLVAVFFIALYLFDELSFDRFHSKADRIYRVIEHQTNEKGEETDFAGVAMMTANLQSEIPTLEKAVLLMFTGRTNVSNEEGTNIFYEDINIAEQGLLDIFDFQVIDGQRENALTKPNTAIITRSSAIKYFGTEKAAGKLLLTEPGDPTYTVTAVIEDFPSNSHISRNMFFSMSTYANDNWYKRFSTSDWTSGYFSVYYLLKEGGDAPATGTLLTNLIKSKREAHSNTFHFWLQPLLDVHFHSANIRGGAASRAGEIYYVYIFGAVGLFILVIALVNYINLSTSLSITRGKEIGVKKVAGAHRHQLIFQFITESTLVTIASVLIALALCNILLPYFNNFTGKTIDMGIFSEPRTLMALVAFAVVVGLLAGSYPALYLSKLKPVTAIKGYARLTNSSSWMRRGLVVFQFFLSITLIIATLTAYRQIEYVNSKSLGFNQQQLVVLDINSGAVRRGFETIVNDLKAIPSATHVTVTSRVPGEWKNLPQVRVNTLENPKGPSAYFIGADENFIATFEMILLSGRNFQESFPGDSSSVILNETAATELGVAAGDEVVIPSELGGAEEEMLDQPYKATVIGIVKDFHFQSLHQKIAPMVIGYRNNPINNIDYFTVRLQNVNMENVLEAMGAAIHRVDPNHLLEYNFLDQRLADFYEADKKRSALFMIAAGVAIALACLGLFSLVSFSTAQRTKEIGVRKVLGASVTQVTVLLSKDYVKLVVIGFVLAAPFSVWALQGWLSSFAYRIDIGWLILTAACLVSLAIALLTVGYKSIRAAVANPVKSLRSE